MFLKKEWKFFFENDEQNAYFYKNNKLIGKESKFNNRLYKLNFTSCGRNKC